MVKTDCMKVSVMISNVVHLIRGTYLRMKNGVAILVVHFNGYLKKHESNKT